MKKMILDYRATDFDDCVAFAHMCFEEQYKGKIEQLLRIFPKNYETKSGMPFWSGLKRCPHPIEFDPENALHIDYIVSAANLRATMFGIPHITDRKVIAEMLSRVLNKVEVPAFHPPPNPDPSVSFHHGSFAVIQNDSARLDQVIQALADWDKLKDMHLTAIEFNKDNDLHVDFIVAASNLRATNYNIVPSDKGRSKLIVDEIIPASSTTTSLVAGLACLELLKLAQNHEKLELFRNSFVNLALPFFSFSEPIPPAEKTVTTAMEPCDVKVCSAEATARSSESYILELQLEFDDILQKGTRTSALEEMQRSVYNLVARKQEDQIYDSVCHALITRLRKVRATVLDKVDERFVETVTQAWREYIERARMVCDVVEYLEKSSCPTEPPRLL
ncbi:ubiquitin-like modifier-activating enzyme 1 [Rhipicephalus sanguineus]|uniref:ubiquitin-like modifier-activating enzyme 1 n=1 Tax=Rhipicephalus sanguineus TaxID=34632 RepID=UPI001892ED82|nr:ubiquitin-like modifier-activating enzyme 1 [Rhipicephalus sanguineus]